MDLDVFTRNYIAAALWSSTGDDGEPMDEGRDATDLSPRGLARVVADCTRFQAENAADIEAGCLTGLPYYEQAGHDFWLTRNGHGCGFWETSDWRPGPGERLTAAAKAFGECHLSVTDDGLIDCE